MPCFQIKISTCHVDIIITQECMYNNIAQFSEMNIKSDINSDNFKSTVKNNCLKCPT